MPPSCRQQFRGQVSYAVPVLKNLRTVPQVYESEQYSLRWHYPNQVPGPGGISPFSARSAGSPLHESSLIPDRQKSNPVIFIFRHCGYNGQGSDSRIRLQGGRKNRGPDIQMADSTQKNKITEQGSAAPVTVGLLAHVDAGKTTLAEAMLFTAGKLRKIGRVDHQDAFLDTYALEKERGITIFSKQAQLLIGSPSVTLLDTPGHVDFSPETERTLQVLDYAILVISAADGVQGHVQTLWRLLEHYQIPVFLFVNKMDQPGTDRTALMGELKELLSDACTDFSVRDAAFYEAAATGSEKALEQYLENGRIGEDAIREMIAVRGIFPCFFGSALKLQGITEFLEALRQYLRPRKYPEAFGARIFKISRDEHGERLTHLKVTGGSLKVKTAPQGTEKINQIRIYDGARYELAEEVSAGTVCTVAGLSQTRCGDGFGTEASGCTAELVPVLTYQVLLPPDCDVQKALIQLRQLEEEEPQLNVSWNEQSAVLHVQVMGEVQLEILKSLLRERFGLEVSFGSGSIIYQETIRDTVEGVGHFEPLRHYAEVHLLLEPAPRGSGLTLAADCSEDMLERNWQRLILTHLAEKQHCGVLTGAPVTDMKITLKAGRAHPKHTQGGDFRQATYRAVRQGLMQAQSVLLEPYYAFRLEIPSPAVGRAMSDIQRMGGTFDPAQAAGDRTVLTGKAPAAAMRDYPKEVVSYTHGTGRVFCEFSGYDVCHDAQAVIAASGYDAERDMENPSSSVFCAHGGGYTVPWNEVPLHMHLESVLEKPRHAGENTYAGKDRKTAGAEKAYGAADNELKEIFERTYGSGSFSRGSRETAYTAGRISHAHSVQEHGTRSEEAGRSGSTRTLGKNSEAEYSAAGPSDRRRHVKEADSLKEQYLLVDGYNIIFAWDELRTLADESADAARGLLMDILCNYQGYRGMTLILVFDAYRVVGNPGESFRYHNIHVVYTKEAETADQYIEKTVHQIGRKYDVTVATSDRLEQVIILGQGARRMSAAELYTEVEEMAAELRREHLAYTPRGGRYLFEDLNEETAKELEAMRLGRR